MATLQQQLSAADDALRDFQTIPLRKSMTPATQTKEG
jgi:hypothetical protein